MDLTKLSDADLLALQAGDLTKMSDDGLAQLSGATPKPKELGIGDAVLAGIAPFTISPDAIAGAVRGAGDIGSTLIGMFDKLPRKAGEPSLGGLLRGERVTDPVRPLTDYDADRRTSMDAALKDMGADPSSTAFKGGKLTSNILGTLGVGGALAAPFKTVAPSLATALQTGGFSAGKLGWSLPGVAARTVAGGVTGGVGAGLVDPKDMGLGAGLGALLPGALKLLGITGHALASMSMPQMTKLAGTLAEMTGKPAEEVLGALTSGGPSMVGAQRTVPQILQNPDISQVARTLKSSGQYQLGAREAENAQALRDTLERVAPTLGTVNDARANIGNAVAGYAKAGEKSASQNVTRLFDAIPKDEARITLPFKAMQAQIDKYLGRASFGEGESAVKTAMAKAKEIGMDAVPIQLEHSSSDAARGLRSAVPTVNTPVSVPFDELQHLRSSIGEAAQKAKLNGDLQASAALRGMKNELDNKMAAIAEVGPTQTGEVFTPAAADAYGQALGAHAAKKTRFNTGPQGAIFRTGADGLPAKEGAEVAPLFWNSGNSQIENLQAFKRLTKDDKDLVSLMKSNATTEALQNAGKGVDGALAYDAFKKWLRTHSGAAKELFTPQELATLRAIEKELETAASANIKGSAQNSHTAQLLQSMSEGPLGSTGQAVTNMLPGGRYWAGPLLSMAKNAGKKSKARDLSALLTDPDLLAKELQSFTARQTPGAVQGALSSPANRVIPLLAADQ
jgi:hypothetical protein